MIERLPFLYPEIALFITTCIVMILGLSRNVAVRRATAVVAGLGVAAAGIIAVWKTPPNDGIALTREQGQILLPFMVPYAKALIAGVGLLLLMLLAGTVDRAEEAAIRAGKRAFDPLRSNRAEFYAFYLFSLTGLMLCAGADDLIWLFLALELTSLPTYIMVSISTARNRSREAGVKYFFLGAMGAAVFLYGFALLYGGTGTTNLNAIADVFARDGVNNIALAGLLVSILGLGFKVAAVPMHFYTPDVYEGAAPQVSAFLAFVPKTAGFIGILLLCATVGWNHGPDPSSNHHLPDVVRLTLWVMAALTMTVGNVLAILQNSVKRILAYSSIAHTGYMLVGVIAGPGDGRFSQNGIAAVLFYLFAYGLMNLGCFAVLAALERRALGGTGLPTGDSEPREIDNIADLRGLCASRPVLGWTMVICSLSLLGFPPLLGFFSKLPLFTSAISAGEIPLVIVLGINSAIAAFYYLRLAFTPFLENADASVEPAHESPFATRKFAGLLAAIAVVVLGVAGYKLMDPVMQHTEQAGAYKAQLPATTANAE
ncbi:MAG TPA: NADH-quinone oxidoreductase subunit N [Phycisphaerales bacterium]|nr:NADH-quinone oxidoreductase subunit N [Phycisphaerales bacterium]